MKRVSIYNSYVKDNPKKRETIEQELRKHGFQTTKKGEFVIIIGGDGTFLSGVKKKIEKDPVFVVMNAGNLGFYSEFHVDDIDKVIEVIKNKDYYIEEHPLYEVHFHGKNGVHIEYFINEVVITEAEDLAIHMVLEVDGHVLFRVPADNMIISGMGGSTGYNVNAGGPISFCHDVYNVAITNPIMNKAFPYRVYPAVIPNSSELKVYPSTLKQRSYKVVCDSREVKDIDYKFITIKKHEKPIKILRTNSYSRIQHIHERLLNFSTSKN